MKLLTRSPHVLEGSLNALPVQPRPAAAWFRGSTAAKPAEVPVRPVGVTYADPRAREEFNQSISQARQLVAASQSLAQQPEEGADSRGVLRAALVLGLQAFDQFMRNRICGELIALCAAAPAALTARAKALHFELGDILQISSAEPLDNIVAAVASRAIQNHNFHSSEQLTDGLQFLKSGNFWVFAALGLGGSEHSLREQLDAIGHHAFAKVTSTETDPAPAENAVSQLSPATASGSFEFLERLVDCIEEYLK